MKNFINCESLSYDTLIDELVIPLSDMTIEEIEYLTRLGFSLVISSGRVNIQGELEVIAKLLQEEIENNLIEQEENHYLRDYVTFNYYNDLTFIVDIAQAIVSTKALKGYGVKIADVFKYIIEDWQLSESQTKALRAQEWEDYQERKHPDDK